MHRRGGSRSHLGVVSPRWGLNTLRLLWNSSRGWTLHHSCIRSQCRRCLYILSRRVASGSPGCAIAISGRGTGLTLGPGSMPSTGANHGGKLKYIMTAAQVLRLALQVTTGETPASAWEEVSYIVRLGRGRGKV